MYLQALFVCVATTVIGLNCSEVTKEAVATIWESPALYVQKGSLISLTCTVNVLSSDSSMSFSWYHGEDMVDLDKKHKMDKTGDGTTHMLLVTEAAYRDSGNYTCVPSNALPTSVFVYVLDGHRPASMASSSRALSDVTSQQLRCLVVYFISCIVYRLI